jgi:hypothetical protein
MGGIYFSVNLLASQLVCWGGIMLYDDKFNNNEEEDEENEELISSSRLLFLGRILSSIWLASIIAIAIKCDKGYRRTFFSTSTAGEFRTEWWHFVISNEKEIDDDGTLIAIFGSHPDIYKHLLAEVRPWLSDNW